MVNYNGQEYKIQKSYYSGTPDGYLYNGAYTTERPTDKIYEGYINTGSEIIFVYHDRPWYFIGAAVIMCIFLVVVLLMNTNVRTIDYRVSFAQEPVYEDGVLYCNVVNVSDIPVEVCFTDGEQRSIMRYLSPGDTISYIEIEFIPTHIIYGGEYIFELGVKHD